ncbi:hypothetical protein J4G48_0040035 [Bradyrhizobium barranii subsp. apii]|uniref:hypothetical protein n=1 Tax=Bradyrhizobium barranii TaxID=2992140 RepID=UPI001AA10FEC|nr:hypothetical protein [Bradyrhizobium barranii]UPT95349.1 hypothetical protein J4G48_0040035 [Bradyrhizobium barranii subsp. apii]
MFRTITSQFKGVLQRFLPVQAAPSPKVVEQASGTTVRSTPAMVGAPEAISVSQKAAVDHKRFRRTAEEIFLGLDQENAKSFRAGTLTVATNLALVERQVNDTLPESKVVEGKAFSHGIEVATVTKNGVEFKAKRFRRTREELRLGLSIDDAAKRRGMTLPAKPAKPKVYVERKPAPAKHTGLDLITTLDRNIQVRARAVSRYRSNGGKGLITAEMLDQIQAAVAAGKATKCPPCTDSDGYNHLTKQEAK